MEDFLKQEKQLFLQTYNRYSVDIACGEGVHLISKSGIRYLDFFSGLGVNVLGHSHPRIIEAIHKQSERFLHLSNYFITDIQLAFAADLLKYTGFSKTFLTNSGTEATEAAIKITRQMKGTGKKIFSLTNSFHGRTYGALSLTNRIKYKQAFEPLLTGIDKIKFNDCEDLNNKINENTAALFIEFIQGESGINLVSKQFAETIKDLKLKYDFMLVADCVQSGIGRTGKPFAFNYYNILPDIVIVAKSIGGGLPLGAVLCNEKYDNVFSYGSHGSTFGGNPLSCAAGLVVLDEVFNKGLMNDVLKLGGYFFNELENLKNTFPNKIKDVRGRGFMIGIEMSHECKVIADNLRERNILVNCTNNNVIRILPPFISKKKDIDFFLYHFNDVLKKSNSNRK